MVPTEQETAPDPTCYVVMYYDVNPDCRKETRGD